jgi:hypothetical protein
MPANNGNKQRNKRHYSCVVSISKGRKRQNAMSLTDSRDCRHNFSQLQLVQNRCFTSGIETDHENTHLLLGKQAGKKLGKREPHLNSSPPPMLSDVNCNRPEKYLNTHTHAQRRLQNSTDLDQEIGFGAPRTHVNFKTATPELQTHRSRFLVYRSKK